MLPKVEPWTPAERLQKEFDAVGFFLTGHPLDDYAAALKRLRVQSWAEFARSVKAGASAGRVAGSVVSRQERRTRTGSKMGIIGLSDPSGHYEAVVFAEGLAHFRDLLEPGKAVLLGLSAEVQGDEVRARIQAVDPLDEAAAKLQKGLRVFLRDERPLESVAKRLEGPAPQRPGAGQSRRRGLDGADAGRGDRGRGQAARPLQGLAADRRRHQGDPRRRRGAGAVASINPSNRPTRGGQLYSLRPARPLRLIRMQKRCSRPFRIVIIGGGIGGLTAAVALHQRGFEVEVYERSTKLEEVGAGLQVGPNAVKVLHALGLKEALDADRLRADQPGLDQVGRRQPAPSRAAQGDRDRRSTARPT